MDRLPRARRPRPRLRAQAPLIVLARDDPAIFGEFYAELHVQVRSFFVRRVFDPEVADDLTAETFADAFGDLQRFRGSTAAAGYAWLWTIARHHLFRWRAAGRVEQAAVTRLGCEPPAGDPELERAEELADLAEQRPALAAASRSLRPDHWRAIRMRVIEERSYEEIAARLGVSETVARAWVSRGLRSFSALLRGPREPSMPHDRAV